MQRNVDIVNMQHPPWWENTTTIITQRRIEVCLEKVVNNTENEKYNAFFYLTDCSPYEDRSNRSLTSLLSAMIETWQSHDLLTAGCDILHRHKRIYLSSWPWLPTVTMPDHRVITTFTLVKFILSFAESILSKYQLAFTHWKFKTNNLYFKRVTPITTKYSP